MMKTRVRYTFECCLSEFVCWLSVCTCMLTTNYCYFTLMFPFHLTLDWIIPICHVNFCRVDVHPGWVFTVLHGGV